MIADERPNKNDEGAISNSLKYSIPIGLMSIIMADLCSATESVLVLDAKNTMIPNTIGSQLKPPLMHARNFNDDELVTDFFVSEKLDGIRAYWDGKQFLSRNGNPINAPLWFVHDFPNTPLDGELWLERNQFDRLSGIVRNKNKQDQWKKIKYMVFDLPDEPANFNHRNLKLQRLVRSKKLAHLSLVNQIELKDSQALMEYLGLIEAKGGEGLMLHRKASFYQASRSYDLQKLKSFNDEEARVIAHIPGKGKYENMLGAIQVINKKGVVFKIGSGFSVKQRQTPPPVNSQITYRFRGVTSKGTPRFATFVRAAVTQ
jgi:DNA ligase-1